MNAHSRENCRQEEYCEVGPVYFGPDPYVQAYFSRFPDTKAALARISSGPLGGAGYQGAPARIEAAEGQGDRMIPKLLKFAPADGWPAVVRDERIVVPNPRAWLEIEVPTCGCDEVVEVRDLGRIYGTSHYDVHMAAESCPARRGFELPAPPPPAGELILPPGDHWRALRRLLPVTTKDPTKPHGIWLTPGAWRAADGYRAAEVRAPMVTRTIGIPIAIAKFLSNLREPFAVTVDDEVTCSAGGPGWRLAFRVQEGELPDYWSLIPEAGAAEAVGEIEARGLRGLRDFSVRVQVSEAGIVVGGVKVGATGRGEWDNVVNGKFLAAAPRVMGTKFLPVEFHRACIVFRGPRERYAIARQKIKA